MRFTINTSGEEEFIGCPCGGSITELQGPQTTDPYGNSVGALKHTTIISGQRIKGMNETVAEVAH
jgi:hypothetical protein